MANLFMKNISVKKSFIYACLCAVFLVSCKKEIEKISDTFKDTVSASETPEAEKDSIKKYVKIITLNYKYSKYLEKYIIKYNY